MGAIKRNKEGVALQKGYNQKERTKPKDNNNSTRDNWPYKIDE